MTRADYLKALQAYARSHQFEGRPYIGEYLDEKTGHCLRPRADETIQVNPLVPESAWDWFCLDNVWYHGQRVTIVWDRKGQRYGQQPGLSILSDGKRIAHSPQLGPLRAALQDQPAPPSASRADPNGRD